MGNGTDWEWSTVDDGHIEGNGRKGSKDATVFGKQRLLMRNTKELGPTVFKMVTVPKLMPIWVRTKH